MRKILRQAAIFLFMVLFSISLPAQAGLVVYDDSQERGYGNILCEAGVSYNENVLERRLKGEDFAALQREGRREEPGDRIWPLFLKVLQD